MIFWFWGFLCRALSKAKIENTLKIYTMQGCLATINLIKNDSKLRDIELPFPVCSDAFIGRLYENLLLKLCDPQMFSVHLQYSLVWMAEVVVVDA